MKIITLIICFTTFGFSQSDSLKTLEREILSTEDTESELLAKSRRTLLSLLQNGDIEKSREIVRFLETRFNQRRVTIFREFERYLVYYWIGEYDRILNTIRTPETADDIRYSKTINPPDDLFLEDLMDLTYRHLPELRKSLASADVQSDGKDFLILFMDYLSAPEPRTRDEYRQRQDDLNSMADEFLSDHGDSPYSAYVRNRIRYVVVPSEYGYGFSFGLGQSSPMGTLSTNFRNAIAFALEFDMTYQSLAGYFQMSLGAGSETIRTFSYGGTWNKGLPILITAADVSLGYVIYEFGGFRMVPTFGIGGFDCSPPENEKNKPGNDVSMTTFASVLSLHFDVPVSGVATPMVGFEESAYWMARIGISHYFSHGSNPIQKGGLFLVTLSIGGFGRPLVREL